MCTTSTCVIEYFLSIVSPGKRTARDKARKTKLYFKSIYEMLIWMRREKQSRIIILENAISQFWRNQILFRIV